MKKLLPIIALLVAASCWGAIVIDNTGQTAKGAETTSVTITNFVVGAGANRLLLVGVSWRQGSDTNHPTGVTFGATALAESGEYFDNSNDNRGVSFWYLIAPASTTANIVVTFSADNNRGVVIGAASFTGVHQTTPLGTFAHDRSASGTTPAITLTSATATDVGFAVLTTSMGGTDATFTVDSGQTQSWQDMETVAGTADNRSAGWYLASAGTSVVLSGVLGSARNWVTGGVLLKAAAEGGGGTRRRVVITQ
jgi:hypothetical protein